MPFIGKKQKIYRNIYLNMPNIIIKTLIITYISQIMIKFINQYPVWILYFKKESRACTNQMANKIRKRKQLKCWKQLRKEQKLKKHLKNLEVMFSESMPELIRIKFRLCQRSKNKKGNKKCQRSLKEGSRNKFKKKSKN